MEYLRTNHLPLAMHYIKQAHAIAPHEPAVLHELGVLHYASGEYAEAADYFTRVAEHELPRRGRAPHLSPSLPIPRALDAEHVPSCLPTSTREDTHPTVVRPHVVFAVLAPLVFTHCSEYAARGRPPAPRLASSRPRLLTNGVSAMLFSILWKYFEQLLNAKKEDPKKGQ